MHKKHLILATALLLSLTACEQSNTAKTSVSNSLHTSEKAAESKKTHDLFKAYFKEYVQMNPVLATYVGVNDYNDQFSPPINVESIALSLAFEEKYLAKIKKIDPDRKSVV